MSKKNIPDYSEIGTIFYHDGYKLAKKHLPVKAGSPESIRSAILQLMNSAYGAMDGLIQSFIERCEREGLKVDCRNGCSYCCHQAVLSSNHEVLVIKNYIDEKVPEETRKKFAGRAKEKNNSTTGMSAMEFLQYIHPCPFLQEGSCQIYEVRPMACRCYLSANLNSCIKQYRAPGDRNQVAELFDFPLQAGRSMNEGIRSALLEAGLAVSEWLLEAFMATIFEDAGKLDQWLAGGTPFNIRILSAEENRYLREYYDAPES